tara:strand:+ start:2156 stop:2305 length:150 start_codon:yes stop_codon:yes gene_type:complete
MFFNVTDIAYTQINDLQNYDTLILGGLTWDVRKLQINWEAFLHNIREFI